MTGNYCDRCLQPWAGVENDYGEFVCDDCEQNAAAAANRSAEAEVTTDPIVLTHEDHLNEIMRRWRHKRADLLAEDVIYNDTLCRVSKAMAEPEPIDKAVTAIWSGYVGFIAFGTLLFWECLRP